MDLEYNTRERLHYGSIPYDQIVKKYEETDMDDAEHDPDRYNDNNVDYAANSYIRKEIIDRNPDVPFFESDKVKRDPSRAWNKLNLQYNATRGNSAELPTHPEMFMGFTDKDPRGVSNDPRLEKSRMYLSGGKAARIQVSMGNNDDNNIAERPWSAQDEMRDKQAMFKIVRNNTKIFTREKMGQNPKNNPNIFNWDRLYHADGENIMQRDVHKESEIYKAFPNPEDYGGIYRYADNPTIFKKELTNIDKQAQLLADSIKDIKYDSETMSKFYQGHKSQGNYTTDASIKDAAKIKDLTSHMVNLHNQIVGIKGTTKATPDSISKAKYLTEQLQDAKKQLDGMTFTTKNPEDIMSINANVELMSKMFNSAQNGSVSNSLVFGDVSKIKDYASLTPLKSKDIQVHNALTKGPEDISKTIEQTLHANIFKHQQQQSTESAKNPELRNAYNSINTAIFNPNKETYSYAGLLPTQPNTITENGDMEFKATADMTNKSSKKVERRNNYNGVEDIDHSQNLIDNHNRGGVLPKSLRKQQLKNNVEESQIMT